MRQFLFIGFCLVLRFLSVEAECSGGKATCEWIAWEAWGSCGRTCGGGTRYRNRPLCCKSDLDFDACLIDCRLQRSEHEEYDDCNTICYNNGSYYGRLCHCPPEYDGYCCLDAKCCYKDHWCWPGYCSGGLAKYCYCDGGFEREGSTSYSKCKLKPSNSPDLLTCRVVILGAAGVAKNSTSGTPNTCLNERFTYFIFQPTKIHFTMESAFEVSIFRSKPDHIEDYNFGVVQNSVTLKRMTVTGQMVDFASPVLLNMIPNCTRSFSDNYPTASIVSCESEVSTPTVMNGERVCLQFTSFGGGFLTTKDFHNAISTKQIYTRTQSSHEVCLRYDDSPPVHCSINSSCLFEPLSVNRRIPIESSVEVRFSGWFDPSPTSSQPDQASGVEKYSLTLLGVQELDHQTLVMKDTLDSTTIPTYKTIYSLNLPKEPFLYALLLKVHDLASNVRGARRFVLYDNSSSVQINHGHTLRVTSANDKTNYTWQVNHDSICLEWTRRYYNSYHKENNLLRRIQVDSSVSLEYDQVYGPLPISGTANVDGIVEFKYQWKFKESVQPPTPKNVPNVTEQSFCESFNISDGETYTFIIMPIDINNRSITENITVHIDSSRPEIDNISLSKNGYEQLYVHSSSDLSKMVLEFEAMDAHSGLNSVEWKVGTSAGSNNIGSGTISVNRSPNETLCSKQYCYCPMVGMCENYFYTVTLNKLDSKEKHESQNNTKYFLSIIVTNNAHLISVGSIVILTDETPPMAGIIQDGPGSGPDIDITNDDEVTVHWDGFIDHESGIKFFRVAVASRCLQQGEFEEKKVFDKAVLIGIKEVFENNASFTIKCPGRYFSSVVAYNNALEPSEVVCSDGFTRNNSESNMAAANDTLGNPDCLQEIGMGNRSDKQSISLIVGIVVGVTLLLVLGVIVTFLVRRRRNVRDKLYDDVQRENQQEVHYSSIKDVIKFTRSKAATKGVPRGKFLQWYNSLMMVDLKSGKSRLLLQFEEYIARMAKKPVPRAYENISLASDYSGANIRMDSITRYHIDGKGRICLITSISMTTSSFWKYVIDNNIGSIISLREPDDKDVDMNENINIQLTDYRVEGKTDKMILGIQYVKLQITHSENFQGKRSVRQVILQVGKEEGELTNVVNNLVTIYIYSVRSIYGSENQNILMHTIQPNNERCGIICCLFSVLQHMDETDKFDLDNSLKHIQHTSEFKLDTFEKYKFLYDVGSQYIKSY